MSDRTGRERPCAQWRRIANAAALALVCGCEERTLPPKGQLVLFIDTDAPLGPIASSRHILESPALFDRLRVEVLSPDGSRACGECGAEFVLTRESLEAAPGLSFGVRLPTGASGYRARLRLFPDEARSGGEPRDDAAIDGLFALPAHGAEGVTEVTAFLPFTTLGQIADLASPGLPIENGHVSRGLRALPRERPQCASEPNPGEVCVPGGAIWASRVLHGLRADVPWGVVVMSPFFLDEREVTVADLRRFKGVTASDPERTAGTSLECTYSSEPGDFEALPVTCVSPALAAAYCQARGQKLPTGAQLEYVRGRLDSLPYVWGNDVPTCDDAVWGRGTTDGWSECAALGRGPQPAGSGKRDRLALPTGELLDVAGNVGEWMADWPFDCLAPGVAPGVTFDPRCKTSKKDTSTSGSFYEDEKFLLSPQRVFFQGPAAIDPKPRARVGFRCARDDSGATE